MSLTSNMKPLNVKNIEFGAIGDGNQMIQKP